MSTIVLAGGGSGGHLFPALAIGRALLELEPTTRLTYAGASRGVEASILPARHLRHHLFPFQPLHRRRWWKNVGWPLLAVRLRREIDAWLDAESPDLVVGTGGYVSAPVVWRAARHGIATAILELDVRPGIATRLVAPRARAIWLATEEAALALPPGLRDRALVTGAPILPPDHARRDGALGRYGFDPGRPIVVITGGSQGSLALNLVVAEWLASGAADQLQLVWVTGTKSFRQFKHLHNPPRVHVQSFVDPMADAWSVADLVVSRAGMMTLAELAAWGIPAVLVPLPSAAADHQTHNATAAATAGAALLLPQAELDPARLSATIGELLTDTARLAAMSAAARARGRPGAAAGLARRAMELLPGPGVCAMRST